MKKHFFYFLFSLFLLPFSGNAKEVMLSCDLDITITNNSITIGNLNAPHSILKLFNPDFSINYNCLDDCNSPTIITDLEEGVTYYLSVNLYDENWVSTCAQAEYITVIGSPCIDLDADGTCAADDCDDNDASIPAAVGTACDDGDPNTENDQIQNDNCTCQGETITNDCDVSWTTTNNSITISGLNSPHVIFKLHNPNWSINSQCFDNCSNPWTIDGLTTGATYHLNYNLYDENWQPICGEVVDVVISGNSVEQADLTLSNLQSDPSGAPGAVTNFTVDLNNIGTEIATGSYLIKAYLSENTALDNADVVVGQIPTGNTGIGTIVAVPGAITVPNWADGNYYLVLKVDDENNISESNENNNTAFTSFEIISNNDSACGFSKTYTYDGGPAIGQFSVQEQTDQYVIIGKSNASFQNPEVREVTFTTDKGGELIDLVDNSYAPFSDPVQVTVETNSNFDLVVTKTSFGNIDWVTTIPFDLPPGNVIIGTNADQVHQVEGGYLVTGTVIPSLNGAPYTFINYTYKLDELGNPSQQNLYPGLIDDFFNLGRSFDVDEGTIFSVFEGGKLSFIKYNDDGEFQWITNYTADLPSNTLIQLGISPDGQFVYASNINNSRTFIDKVATDTGEKIYKVNIGNLFSDPNDPNSFYDYTAGFLLTDDGGVVTGISHSYSNNSTIPEPFIYGKLDSDGNPIWVNRIESSFPLRPAIQTSDDGYYWLSNKPSQITQDPKELVVLKTTATGETTPSCESDTNPGVDLGCELSYTSNGSNISITGTGFNAGHVIIKVFGPSWNTLYSCFDDCGNSIDLTGLAAGTYRVSVDLYNANWEPSCNFLEDVLISGANNLEGSGAEDITEITNKELEKAIVVYPNPASDQVFLRMETFAGESASISIYNQLGQQMKQLDLASISSEPQLFLTNDLPDGLYFINIKIGDRKGITKKLVVGKL